MNYLQEVFPKLFNDGDISPQREADGNTGMDLSMDGKYFICKITLNDTLKSGSEEYIAATIFHELMHAWIDRQYTTTSENINQHNLMADPERFDMMKNALIEMFPSLNVNDAADLVWGGLQTTIPWYNLNEFEKSRIAENNMKFKSGAKGTKCTH